ncbi:MAG: carboxypeptidase regulatory-like domain-containing protein [Terriglobales bacterium]
MRKQRTLGVFPILLFLITLISWQLSQGQTASGSLRGEVQDANGRRVAAATVTVEARGSGLRREVKADDHGEFRVNDLLPGPYRVVVRAEGFGEASSDVDVVVSFVRDLLVALKPAAVQQTVNVQGQASSITTEPIDTASAVHQGAVSSRDLTMIPLAHRSFANIAYLVPGTEPVEPSDPSKARITAVSTGGSSGLNNVLSVDGMDDSDDYIGGFLQNFSPDAIQEFAFRTAQEDADTGRTTAGSVVITTKHGTNDWHGSAAFYERASALTARYPIENPAPDPKQPFSRQNYVGTLGGPLKKDKLWVFASFEYVHEDASIAYSPDSQAEFTALAALAAQGLIPGVSSIPVPQSTPIPFRDAIGLLRFDWAQSQKSQWFLRGSIDNYTTENNYVQQATLPSTGTTSGSKYGNVVINNTYAFSPNWLGSFTIGASTLHHTEARNEYLGFALAFPFSSTSQTISGFETFGDNQFQTAITAFPVLRNQEKYQFRYDLSHSSGKHSTKFGIDFIHEPVLSGALSGTAETFLQYANNPSFYAADPSQFYFDLNCNAPPADVACAQTPAGDGSFTQSVRRLGFYAQDSWRVSRNLTVNYGLRWDTTFGLLTASGRDQTQNPSYPDLQALGINGAPHDYRKAFAPRLGIAYAPGSGEKTVLRAGFGLYYSDLAQNGWVAALQAVNGSGAGGAIIDPHYRTPYAIHATAGIQHAFNDHWILGADYTRETGMHGYRAYSFPDLDLFKSDNRSSYDALMIRLQGNTRRASLIAHYTLSSAKTWGCVLGELWDYVNGVCDPLNPFAPGDYGPSGEDVRHRFVLSGIFHAPGGFELSTLTQAESARPFTITTAEGDQRISVNGVPTSLDEFRGTPYIQVDLRVARPVKFREDWTVMPFIEFFNLFNRNNPGANFVTNVAALPLPPGQFVPGGVIGITSLKQLEVPAGGLGDFFGPGTTVGIPFAAQVGVRVSF